WRAGLCLSSACAFRSYWRRQRCWSCCCCYSKLSRESRRVLPPEKLSLPIKKKRYDDVSRRVAAECPRRNGSDRNYPGRGHSRGGGADGRLRSEERRVGKE